MPRKSKPTYAIPTLEWWQANPNVEYVATDWSGDVYAYWQGKPYISKSETPTCWLTSVKAELSLLPLAEFPDIAQPCLDWQDSLVARPVGQLEVEAMTKRPRNKKAEVAPPTYLHSPTLRRAIDLTGHAEDNVGNALALATMYATIALAEAAERIAQALQARE